MAKRTNGRKRRKRGLRGRMAASQQSSFDRAVAGLHAYRDSLLGERMALEKRIAAIEAALGAMGGAPPVAPRQAGPGRPRGGRVRAGSLKDYIQRVLAGRGVMSVKDITSAVMAAGYSTRNRTLSKSVGIALSQMGNVVKVRRGQFRLK